MANAWISFANTLLRRVHLEFRPFLLLMLAGQPFHLLTLWTNMSMSEDTLLDKKRRRPESSTGIQRFVYAPASAISLTIVLAAFSAILGTFFWSFNTDAGQFASALSNHPIGPDAISKEAILSRCTGLRVIPSPPAAFHSREESDRFEERTNSTLIRNAIIFTGRDNGTEIIHGDLLLDKGIVKGIGKISGRVLDSIPNLAVVNASGAWITPGIGIVVITFLWRWV